MKRLNSKVLGDFFQGQKADRRQEVRVRMEQSRMNKK
jgi:hypothetical protein